MKQNKQQSETNLTVNFSYCYNDSSINIDNNNNNEKNIFQYIGSGNIINGLGSESGSRRLIFGRIFEIVNEVVETVSGVVKYNN